MIAVSPGALVWWGTVDLWIYCPGLAGVSEIEWADRLASTADITSGLQLGRAEVLRGLRNFHNTDKPEHHSIDRLRERLVGKGSGRHSTLQGWERSEFNQTNTGTVSRATLGRLLRAGAERVWAFPSATMPFWAETETGKGLKDARLHRTPQLSPLEGGEADPLLCTMSGLSNTSIAKACGSLAVHRLVGRTGSQPEARIARSPPPGRHLRAVASAHCCSGE